MLAFLFLAWWGLDYLTGGSGLLALALVCGGYVLWLGVLDVKDHLGKQGPREAALSEASYGAAMIALPVLAYWYWHIGAVLPPWFPYLMLALMIFGGLKFARGAKFSVGWRDPVLMVRFAVKIGLGVVAFPPAGVFGHLIELALQLLGWWLVITGATKLLLVLRGLPQMPLPPPGKPYGDGDFWNPNQHP